MIVKAEVVADNGSELFIKVEKPFDKVGNAFSLYAIIVDN